MTHANRDLTRELYPFLHAETAGADTMDAVLAEVRASTLQKCRDTIALRSQLQREYSDMLVDAAEAMAASFAHGGKLLAFGNGGSATDAADAVADCLDPPRDGWRPLPAISLVGDPAIITALANDVGIEHVFARQVMAYAERGDIALGISTSGNSASVVGALVEAKRRGLLTVALAGYDGGAMARSGAADFCFLARLEYVPRIQEGHATLWHVLLELIQECLADREGARS